MKLADLKTQALRYLALGEHDRALLLYHSLIRQLPDDLDLRMKVADALAQCELPHLASRVYAAVAWCDLQAGRPLHALVCCQALSDLGQDVGVAALHESLAELYGATSPRLRRGVDGPAPQPPDPDREVAPPEMLDVSAKVAAEVTTEVAADTATFSTFPALFQPVPLLSDLTGAAFAHISRAALIRRVGPGTVLFQQGTHGHSLYWIASGAVDLYAEGPPRVALRRLTEGDILGGRALVTTRPRTATAETSEPSDLIELPLRLLRGVGEPIGTELDQAVGRFCRERLLWAIAQEALLLQPFTSGQREELVRRITAHEVEADTILLREGEVADGLYVVQSGQVEVYKGSEPFETVEQRWEAGDMGCESWLLKPTASPSSLRATARTTVLVLTRDVFLRFCHETPAVARAVEQIAARYGRELHRMGRSVLPGPGVPSGDVPELA